MQHSTAQYSTVRHIVVQDKGGIIGRKDECLLTFEGEERFLEWEREREVLVVWKGRNLGGRTAPTGGTEVAILKSLSLSLSDPDSLTLSLSELSPSFLPCAEERGTEVEREVERRDCRGTMTGM